MYFPRFYNIYCRQRFILPGQSREVEQFLFFTFRLLTTLSPPNWMYGKCVCVFGSGTVQTASKHTQINHCTIQESRVKRRIGESRMWLLLMCCVYLRLFWLDFSQILHLFERIKYVQMRFFQLSSIPYLRPLMRG
jgi:hypothetical protein